MYRTRRSMPCWSPAGRYTDWSTLQAAVLPGAHVLDHFRFDLALGQVQGVPMNEFPMSLYCPYHAGQHILAAEHASHFGLDA